MFFSFDGVDGSGKTTQIELFYQWLREQGREVVQCRDPGGTRLGEAIREILLNRNDLAIARRGEMLLYMAARAQLVDEIIAPALASGKTVVCDRFLLANVVYQGHAGGLDVATLWRIGQVATAGLMPDLTFLLDLADQQAATRLDRPLDRMEQQGAAFRTALRSGYLAEAARQPERIVIIDASRTIEDVQREVRAAAAKAFASC